MGIRPGQIDLIQHGQDLQVVIQGQIGVPQSLRFDPLPGIHHQQGSLTGCQAPGDLIVEVHMPGSVDQIQPVNLPVLRLIAHAHGPGLDGDAPLPLQLHIIQDLRFHIPFRHRVAALQDPVRQRAFAMVDMGNDAEIPYPFLIGHACSLHSSQNLRRISSALSTSSGVGCRSGAPGSPGKSLERARPEQTRARV